HCAARRAAWSMWPCACQSRSKCGDFAGMRMYSISVGTMGSCENSEMFIRGRRWLETGKIHRDARTDDPVRGPLGLRGSTPYWACGPPVWGMKRVAPARKVLSGEAYESRRQAVQPAGAQLARVPAPGARAHRERCAACRGAAYAGAGCRGARAGAALLDPADRPKARAAQFHRRPE